MTDTVDKKSELEQYGVWVKTPPVDVNDSVDNAKKNDVSDIDTDSFVSPDNKSSPKKVSSFSMIDVSAISDHNGALELKPHSQDLPSGTSDKDSMIIIPENGSTLEGTNSTINKSITPSMSVVSEKSQQESISKEPNAPTDDDFSLDNILSSISDITPSDKKADSSTLTANSTPEEISLDDFMSSSEEISVDDFMSSSEEISVDDFMSSSNEVSIDDFMGGSNGEISLDDFMGDSGFSNTPTQKSSKEEKNDIIGDPALDMNLTFDDNYVLETRADPVAQLESVSFDGSEGEVSFDSFDDMFDSIVDESSNINQLEDSLSSAGVPEPSESISDMQEFDPSMFDDSNLSDVITTANTSESIPTESENEILIPKDQLTNFTEDIPQTNTQETIETNNIDFDSAEMFSTIPEVKNSSQPSITSTQSDGFDNATEFDDFLKDIEDTPSAVSKTPERGSVSISSSDYDLSVTVDDITENEQEQKEIDDESLEDIPLFGNSAEAHNSITDPKKQLDISTNSSYTYTNELEVESIMSNMEDFGADINFEDITQPDSSDKIDSPSKQEDTNLSLDDFDFPISEDLSASDNSFELPDDNTFTSESSSSNQTFDIPQVTEPEISSIPFDIDSMDMPEVESTTTEQEQVLFEPDSIIDEAINSDTKVTECDNSDITINENLSDDTVINDTSTDDLSVSSESDAVPDDFAANTESDVVPDDFAANTESDTVSDDFTANTESDAVSDDFAANTESDAVPDDFTANTESDVVSDDFADNTKSNSDISEDTSTPETIDATTEAFDIPFTSSNPIQDSVDSTESPDESYNTISDSQDNDSEDLTSMDTTQNNTSEASEMSSSILSKILDELSQIRSDITNLRTDVDNLQKKETLTTEESQVNNEDFSISQTDSPISTTQSTEDDIIPPTSTSGFFSDDVEDETIALSGDELNNILNTADFTEEYADSSDEGTTEETTFSDEVPPESDTNFSEDVVTDDAITNEQDDLPTEGSTDFLESNEDISVGDILEGNQELDTEEPTPNALDITGFDDISTQIPAEVIASAENTPITSDDDFYDTSEVTLPPISFDDEKLEEPVLDDLDFSIDNNEQQNETDTLPDEIEVPTAEDIIVESSTTDFIDSEDPPITETLTTDRLDYLASDNVQNIDDTPIVEDIIDENNTVEIEENPITEPTDQIFEGSQWESPEAIDNELKDDIPDINDDEITSQDETIQEESIQPTESTVDQSNESLAKPDDTSNLSSDSINDIPLELKHDIKSVLSYMDQLLENLPEEKIAEFVKSEHFDVYKKLFSELGLS